MMAAQGLLCPGETRLRTGVEGRSGGQEWRLSPQQRVERSVLHSVFFHSEASA